MPNGKNVNFALRFSSAGIHKVKRNLSVARFAHALCHLSAKALVQITQDMHKPSNAYPQQHVPFSPQVQCNCYVLPKELHFNSKVFPAAIPAIQHGKRQDIHCSSEKQQTISWTTREPSLKGQTEFNYPKPSI